jgi:protein phosphatase
MNFRAILDDYLPSLSFDVSAYAECRVTLSLPVLPLPVLSHLFSQVQTLFSAEPTLLDISPPCYVVGDIHGQLLDLMRILQAFREPGPHSYLFLGDIVDRGQFSLEALTIVLLLKCLWPSSVFIIRGNHEFMQVSSQGETGLLSQIISVYGNDSLFQQAVKAFAYIPFGARIGRRILCVHGGIGPDLSDADDIRFIARPIDLYDDDNVIALTWSDPCDSIDDFRPSPTRGAGYIFGGAVLRSFLERSDIDVLVRGHECVQDGFASHFDGKCITVFSASNYCGHTNNQAAVLYVESEGRFEAKTFPALTWLLRRDVEFRSNELTGGQASRIRSKTRTMTARQVLASTSRSTPGKRPLESAKPHRMDTPVLISKSPSVLPPSTFLEEVRQAARRKTVE